jgi:thiamine biosynthesis lipoprotein
VHATSCIVAGSASTIAMLKGAAEGEAWLRELGLPYYCILGDGGVSHTMG